MADDSDDFQLAVEHYRVQFPDIASLGDGAVPSLWKAEYDRVAESTFGATLVNQTSSEGTTVGSIRHFAQGVLLRALHARRKELDSSYKPFAEIAADPRPPRSLGITVRLGYC